MTHVPFAIIRVIDQSMLVAVILTAQHTHILFSHLPYGVVCSALVTLLSMPQPVFHAHECLTTVDTNFFRILFRVVSSHNVK